jgi:hypothetical protein
LFVSGEFFFLPPSAADREQVKHRKMSAASRHADPTAVTASESAPDPLQLLQRLQTLELQTDLDAQNIAQLREQNKALEDALNAEQARGEKHAEALTGIQRTCDSVMRTCENRVDEMKMTVAAVAAENSALRAANSALEAEVAVLQAQTTSKLTDIHAAIAALQTLEIHPVRPDRRQFAEWHSGPVPAYVAFDRAWCTAACGKSWKVDIDAATGMRAHATQQGKFFLTLRSAAPFPRPQPLALAAEWRQHRLPVFRIVIEAYNVSSLWKCCHLGFVPSHRARAGADAASAVSPVVGHNIQDYGGWYITVSYEPLRGSVDGEWNSGWAVLQPSGGDTDGASSNSSTYATTAEVPPVPPGGAVEFAVDYAAGTCRVAFYTPAAVAGGFVEAPHAKMELRFVATGANEQMEIPARSVPTLADSGVELYPAIDTSCPGTIWRFAS